MSGLRQTQVEISSVTWRDWNTGEETDFAEANCGTFYFDGDPSGTTNSACALGGSGGETVASAANATEGCKNALASVCYTVREYVCEPVAIPYR